MRKTIFTVSLVLVVAANGLATWRQGAPVYFPLFMLLTLEANLWWGWQGRLAGGLGGGLAVLGLGLVVPCVPAALACGAALVTLGGAIVLGCLGRWLQKRALGAPSAGELATAAPNEEAACAHG